MHPRRAGLSSGMKNEKPVKNSIIAMSGKVTRSRLRRPKVSMVYMAGIANRKLIAPPPKEVRSAALREKPAFWKIAVE